MVAEELTCPHCDETFPIGEAAWTVCKTCGDIFPPGESWLGHGPGVGEGEIFAECSMAVNVYTEKAALEKQEDIRERRRDDYLEHYGEVPWEDES